MAVNVQSLANKIVTQMGTPEERDALRALVQIDRDTTLDDLSSEARTVKHIQDIATDAGLGHVTLLTAMMAAELALSVVAS